jgi:hypothetical protein
MSVSSGTSLSLGGPIQNDDRLSASEDSTSRRNPRSNAATGASAAGVRALSAQFVAFYFRVPVKAFFRTRVEYVLDLPALDIDSRLTISIHLLPQLHGIPILTFLHPFDSTWLPRATNIKYGHCFWIGVC